MVRHALFRAGTILGKASCALRLLGLSVLALLVMNTLFLFSHPVSVSFFIFLSRRVRRHTFHTANVLNTVGNDYVLFVKAH
jgi:hypothetical protein